MIAFGIFIALQTANASASARATVEIGSREEVINAAGQNNQGVSVIGVLDMLDGKTGVPLGSTPNEAVVELRRIGEGGNPCALIQAARVERELLHDLSAATLDLNRAITLGCPDARYELAAGLVREHADIVVAEKTLEQAAILGDPRAYTLLGRLYRTGEVGGRVDLLRAEQNFLRAAIAGDAAGQAELAGSFRERDTVAPSHALFEQALYWSLVSARGGGEAAEAIAREMLEKAPTRLTQRRIARLQAGAKAFRPSMNGRSGISRTP